MKNRILKIGKIFLLIIVIVISFSNTQIFESKVNNNNLDKTVNLSTMAMKITEFDYNEKYSAKDTYTGDLTGYVYNCPACTGRLACMSNLDLSNGTITYNDETYGEVYIVASSTNLDCGTIVAFDSSRVSQNKVYAIVLDRGVVGNALDLLTISEDDALNRIGRSTITYDVLRKGW